MTESSGRAYPRVGLFVGEQCRQFVHRVRRTYLNQTQSAERPQRRGCVRAPTPRWLVLHMPNPGAIQVLVIAISSQQRFHNGGLSSAALVSFRRVNHEAMKCRDEIGDEVVIFDMSGDLRRLGDDEAGLARKMLSKLFASFGSIRRLAERRKFSEPIF